MVKKKLKMDFVREGEALNHGKRQSQGLITPSSGVLNGMKGVLCYNSYLTVSSDVLKRCTSGTGHCSGG